MIEANTAPADTPAAPAAKDDPLASLAGQLRHASTGTLARLRRHHPQQSQGALFDAERLLWVALGERPLAEHEPWALLLHCLALAQGRHDIRADFEPGIVLARLGFKEGRVRQLAEADAESLADLLPRLARRLAVAGATINWWPLATLLLHAGSADADRRATEDAARLRIVHHYVLTLSRAAAAADRDAAVPPL